MSKISWKSAFFGFLISASATSLICLLFYSYADTAASNVSDSQFQFDHANDLRRQAFELGTIFAVTLLIYWVVSALYGRNNVLSIKWANYPLMISCFIFLLLFSNSFIFNIETYCHQFPQSHSGFSITRITECPSSGILFDGLQFIAFILFFHSLFY